MALPQVPGGKRSGYEMKSRPSLYQFGPFRLDRQERLLLRDEQRIHLTPKAFETLLVLLDNNGRLVEKEELLKRVWPGTFVTETTLAQNVLTLRKALGEAPDGGQYIETVPRGGYRFIASVQAVPANEQVVGGGAGMAARRMALWRSWMGIGLLAALTLGGASLLG